MVKRVSFSRFASLMTILCFCYVLAFIQQSATNYFTLMEGQKISEQIKQRLNHKSTSRSRVIPSYHNGNAFVPSLSTSTNSPINNRLIVSSANESHATNALFTLKDIYISVKTTKKYHSTRLRLIIDTWFQTAKNETFFITDSYDEKYAKLTGGHLINTSCNVGHLRQDLSCKLGVEYDGYLKSNKKFWCHFDDDNYVNVKELVTLLRRYRWDDDVYLGKPSLKQPFHLNHQKKRLAFWFGTGGAGVCISRSLANKMAPWCSKGKMARTSDNLKIPDDVTLGYVIENRLGVNLNKSDLLHSHLEGLSNLNSTSILKQVSLSYQLNNKNITKSNVIKIQSWNKLRRKDPTRFLSLHCHLHPDTGYCQGR